METEEVTFVQEEQDKFEMIQDDLGKIVTSLLLNDTMT